MTNRDLLKEAIADAKTIKETAIVNAKAALEEAFTPYLKERLTAKLQEMDEEDEIEENDLTADEKAPADYGKIRNVNDYTDNFPLKKSKISIYGDDESESMGAKELDEYSEEQPYRHDKSDDEDEVDLDELLRELDAIGEDNTMNENEDLINDPKYPSNNNAKGNVAEAEDEVEFEDEDADGIEDSEDEEIDIASMDEDDLKSFIESVIADMVSSGELEGKEDEEGEEEEEESNEEPVMEHYINEAKKQFIKAKKEADAKKVKAKKVKAKKEDEEEENETIKAKKEAADAKKELKEAYNAINTIKSELSEVNLFNAKLLYTNKIFKAKNLTESQKVKVLTSFDKATSIKEAKLVYETLNEGLKAPKSFVNESMLRSSASRASGVIDKKPILEVNNQFARWQMLAGIKKD
jgi:Arc/MetJ family transcription regulator